MILNVTYEIEGGVINEGLTLCNGCREELLSLGYDLEWVDSLDKDDWYECDRCSRQFRPYP